jgi:hypothetical protein
MTRLVILVVLSACILSIIVMSTNWLPSSLAPQTKPMDPDWPPMMLVTESPGANPEKTPSKGDRQNIPDWLLALSALASHRSTEHQEYVEKQPEITLGKPEPDCRVIYVPILQNETSRRGPEIDLTRMIVQEIQARTLFKITDARDKADLALQGKIFLQTIKNKGEKLKKVNRDLNVFVLEYELRDLHEGKILGGNRLMGHDLRIMKFGDSTLLDDRTLADMARNVVDVIVNKGGQ